MSASQVHAVIAAGLEDPTLLERWRREPDLLRKCGVDPAAFDLDAIWKFAGLSAKVRHNGLRADLPLTFRLLNVAGLEIDVFASYAAFRAAEGKTYAATSDARSQDLLLFLEQWLDFDKQEHALLWDLIRHELALSRLGKISPRPRLASRESRPTGNDTGRLRAASVPRLCGDIVLHEMRSDPRITGKLLRQKNPKLSEVSLDGFYFCYWRGTAEELFILEFDELGFYLLSLVDGARSTADLAHLISGSRRPSPGLLQALSKLADIGIIRV